MILCEILFEILLCMNGFRYRQGFRTACRGLLGHPKSHLIKKSHHWLKVMAMLSGDSQTGWFCVVVELLPTGLPCLGNYFMITLVGKRPRLGYTVSVINRAWEPNGRPFCSAEYKTFICWAKLVKLCPHLDLTFIYRTTSTIFRQRVFHLFRTIFFLKKNICPIDKCKI